MIEALLVKPERGKPLIPVREIHFTDQGIIGHVPCPPLRQVLILPSAVLRTHSIHPGDLRENVIVDFSELHDLPSGTVIRIGEALIRLTFHCEPCNRIADKVRIRHIVHNRGFLGSFLNQGAMKLGDSMAITGTRYDQIPYDLSERIAWYLDSQNASVPVGKLLWEIGLSASYARAVPVLLKKLPGKYRAMVVFESHPLIQHAGSALQRD